MSIVTPSLNQGRFIRATIESVLSQDYSPIEYFVIDGGSIDQTLEILRGYGPRVRWISAPDQGQSDAINKGWRLSRGEIVAWLNSDDTYLPGAVRKAVGFLQQHPDVGALYGDGYHTDADGTVRERYPTEPFSLRRLQKTCFICQPTVFIRRSILDQVGYLDTSLKYCMDYDIWIRIARSSGFRYLPEYLATTRLHSAAKTLADRRQAHFEIIRMVHRHFGSVPASWVYAYACAVLESANPRKTAWDEFLFVVGLVRIGFVTFVRYNWRVPLRRLVRSR